ncbi:MAG: beta-N-acetylhexosaminidase [Alphaproteobacteria bacterium]|nr:beta-N-acetylhexosaminidase [Alphaproteobacteria bacterium]
MSLDLRDFAEGAEKSLPCIFAVEGLSLSEGEASLFAQANPLGFILFKRNCDNPEQVKGLVAHLKELVGRDCPILIDQEGGRVARLKPPHWGEYKPMRFYGEMYEKRGAEEAKDALRKDMAALAGELVEMGINVDCSPVLDLLFEGAHDIIGDRAFSGNPEIVAALGKVVCKTFLEAGVTPVIKHIPGHGRALADSHKELPYVRDVSRTILKDNDFAPFAALSKGKLGMQIWAMSAHIKYEAFKEDLPVSLSAYIIDEIIRRKIDFDGVLICDDLDMKALDAYGSLAQKAVKALEAGCDLSLYCSGKLKDMEALADELPRISETTLRRLERAAGISGMAV